jgi:hypothetical protein
MEIMDATIWTELISTVGFPIALVIAMGFFIWTIYKQSVAREEKLLTEIAENRAVNEKAIETLAVYAERLGVIENDVREIKEIITHE